jgi:protein gp37
MADRSKIAWTDSTWNPVTGCTPVTAGCKNCYAARMVKRFPHLHGEYKTYSRNPIPFGRVQFHPDRLDIPLRWKKPRRIFVGSMGDLFHENVEHGWIASVFSYIEAAPQHTFMILTKRPDRMLYHFRGGLSKKFPVLPNLWLGATIEDQEAADWRVSVLLECPAVIHFVSAEPMLGPLQLDRIRHGNAGGYEDAFSDPGDWGDVPQGDRPGGVDWVICGGETGSRASPMHPDWPRSLRDQCQAAGVPFFFKQWGNWRPAFTGETVDVERGVHEWNDGVLSLRVGNKSAGRLLDGREWNESPR